MATEKPRKIEDLILDAKVILGDIATALSYDDRVRLSSEKKLMAKGRVHMASESLSVIMKQLLER